MIYEPTRLDGEDRDAYLARFIRVNQPLWTALTPDEWAQIEHHVVTCDFPETAAGWLDIGRQAGFAKATQLFDDPTNFYRVYPLRRLKRRSARGHSRRGFRAAPIPDTAGGAAGRRARR